MNITGAHLTQNNKIVMFNETSIFVNEIVPASSVLKIDDKVCYLQHGNLNIVDGVSFSVGIEF